MKTFYFTFFLAAVFLVSSCTSSNQEEIVSFDPDNKLDVFAQCLKDSGMKMYGSMTCSICKRQRSDFGSSFRFVGEIECHPRGENPQTELCLQKDIEKTPTWTIERDGEEIERLVGFQKLSTLAEISGCQLEET